MLRFAHKLFSGTFAGSEMPFFFTCGVRTNLQRHTEDRRENSMWVIAWIKPTSYLICECHANTSLVRCASQQMALLLWLCNDWPFCLSFLFLSHLLRQHRCLSEDNSHWTEDCSIDCISQPYNILDMDLILNYFFVISLFTLHHFPLSPPEINTHWFSHHQ